MSLSSNPDNHNTPEKKPAVIFSARITGSLTDDTDYDNLCFSSSGYVPEKSNQRARDEIDLLLQKQGFPEINRHWQHFRKMNADLSSIQEAELFRLRQQHCYPLGKHPLLMTTLITCGAVWLGWSYSSLVSQDFQYIITAIAAVNISFLALIGMTSIRRRLLSNMEDCMAKETAFMLSKPDFRDYFEKLSRTAEIDCQLQKLGFSRLWDNPEWQILYSRSKKSIESRKWSAAEISFDCIRGVLGRKENRNFIRGQFFADLKEGKQSISAIVSRFDNQIKSIKDGTASESDCISFLQELDSLFLKQGSAGSRHIQSTIKKISGSLEYAEWKAEIWKRDPIKDLTHQEEFYSSASLRGVKTIGRGVKGRLGTFLYHWNRSITMLDICSARGRVIRARLIAVAAKTADGKIIPAILADGVEGTTAVPHDIIQQAIEDYGKACGAKAVLYNGFAYNQVPKLFARFIGKKSKGLVKVKLNIADDTERQYLDSFGLPLEPFEYSHAKGSVCVHSSNLSNNSLEFSNATFQDRVFQYFRRGILSVLTTQAIISSSLLNFPQSKIAAGSILLFGAAGMAANYMFQRRSLRKNKN